MAKPKKRKVILPQGRGIRDWLMKENVEFDMNLTLSTTVIKTDDTTYLCGKTQLTKSEFSLISMVKSNAQKVAAKNNFKVQPYDASDISYYRFNDLVPGIHKDYIEVDVNAAYWDIAYQLGYIDKRIYDYGISFRKRNKKIGKRACLVSLGSMASKKKMYHFDGDFFEFLDYDVDEVTRSYFFDISKYLDVIMNEIILEIGRECFLFYWVDAFFVKRNQAQKVISLLKKHSLKSKVKNLMHIDIHRTDSGFMFWILEKGNLYPDKTDINIRQFQKQGVNDHEKAVHNNLKKKMYLNMDRFR